MSAPFQPGDVVVCVDAGRRDGAGYVPTLCSITTGAIYRVCECDEFIDSSGAWFWGVTLQGEPDDGSSWEADRFRKIDDEVTDEFRELLRKLPVKKGVSA